MEEMRENARKNSVNVDRERVLRRKVRALESFRNKALAIIGLLVVTTTVQFGADVADRLSTGQELKAYFSEVNAKTSNETHITANHDGYYYDVGDLISYIKEVPEEIPERMYGVMRSMGFDVSWNIDEFDTIVSRVYINEDGTPMYDSYNDFLIKNKFVDKDGKPSTKEYNNRMLEYMRKKVEYNEQLESIKGNVR